MTVTDRAAGVLDKLRPPKATIPPSVKKRVQRGQDALETKHLARRKQNLEFTRNNHFVSIAKDGKKLDHQSTVDRVHGGDKDDWRVRRSHDILAPILKGKTSAVTQRIPAYEVLESSSDPEDYAGARIGERVLRGGHEIWGVREAFRRAAWLAYVTEESFVMPHFDTSIGPFLPDPEQPGRAIGMGEIRYAVYSGLEVVWEDGAQFEESPWYAIIHARPREAIEQEEGFLGGELKPDATSSAHFDMAGSKGADLVMTTDYLERPCSKYPNGRRFIYANDRQIFPEGNYPLQNQKGEVVDEPCLRRIAYAIDGGSDRARGLVTSLIEVVRDFDFAANKAVEYLQLVMVPQMVGPEGALKSEPSDEPGAYLEVDKEVWEDGLKPEWREMPPMPPEFGAERDRAQALLGFIGNENLVPSQVESAKAIGTLAQKDALAWNDFVEDVEACYAACARDSLVLVQRYYTDERMIQFRGRTGWEALQDFRGADIRGQTDVRIRPGSIEALTRAAVEQRIMNVAAMFPGYFPPEVIIAALSSGDFDRLNESYEEDEAQVNFIISQIRAGTFWELPPRPALPGEEAPQLDLTGRPVFDELGNPVMLAQLPGWMPRPFDGIPVFKRRIENFMKSDEWRHLDAMAQRATGLFYQALLQLEAKKAAESAFVQNQTAAQLGAENAARPAQTKQMPSLPSPAGAEGAQAA
jgi:hypothetical protein